MLRVLVVEDEQAFRHQLQNDLERIPDVAVQTAASRESALVAISGNSFDLVLCDLKIPPEDGGLNLAEEHGFFVYEHLRDTCPGVVSIFFTGFATQQNTRDRLAEAPVEDIFGLNQGHPMTRLKTKEEYLDCIAEVKAHAEAIAELDNIDVSGVTDLGIDEFRILRIFARRLDGSGVEIGASSGLSGTRNLRVRVVDRYGNVRARAFAKIGPHYCIKREVANYDAHVPALLPIGSYAPRADTVLAGGGNFGGIFYRLAEEYDEDLFVATAADSSRSISIVNSIRTHLAHWSATERVVRSSVGELRRGEIHDDELMSYRLRLGTAAGRFEGVEVSLVEHLQHGDLHGENVLVSGEEGVLIDFGDARYLPAGYDPIAMELSFVFHPASPCAGSDWPTVSHAENFFDLERYVINCPVAPAIRACRAWAEDLGLDDVHWAAIVYSRSMRQLKYPQSDKSVALALVNAAAEVGLASQGTWKRRVFRWLNALMRLIGR